MKTVAVALAMALVGCVQSPEPAPRTTPYQPLSGRGGYTTTKLMAGRYLITFSGNGWTEYETVLKYAYRRAAEVCRSGFDVLSTSDVSLTEDDDSAESVEVPVGYSRLTSTRHHHDVHTRPRVRLEVRCKASADAAVDKGDDDGSGAGRK